MKKTIVALVILAAIRMTAATTPEEIAEVLSQLVVNTRAAIAENFTKPNKVPWLPDALYRRILAVNGVLPAAVPGRHSTL